MGEMADRGDFVIVTDASLQLNSHNQTLGSLSGSGIVNLGEHGVQVVLGPEADLVAGAIRAELAAPAAGAQAIVAALGGGANVATLERAAGRVLVTVRDAARVDLNALAAALERGVARPSAASVHLLHADPEALQRDLAPLLG